jgi:hypothetical protein
MAAPLARKANEEPSKLPVGYGSPGGQAVEFSLADGVTSDVTFLRLFVSTTYVDMTAVEQPSPFDTNRKINKATPPSKQIWNAWTYVLMTKRQGTDSTAQVQK